MQDAIDLMWRDVTEAPWLVAFMMAPVVVAGIALRRGSRLALVPIGIFIAQMGLWFCYYATDWFGNPGMAGIWAWGILPTAAGLVIAAAALTRSRTEG